MSNMVNTIPDETLMDNIVNTIQLDTQRPIHIGSNSAAHFSVQTPPHSHWWKSRPKYYPHGLHKQPTPYPSVHKRVSTSAYIPWKICPPIYYTKHCKSVQKFNRRRAKGNHTTHSKNGTRSTTALPFFSLRS